MGWGWMVCGVCECASAQQRSTQSKCICVCVCLRKRKFIFSMTLPPTTDSSPLSLLLSLVSCVDYLSPTILEKGPRTTSVGEPIQKKKKERRSYLSSDPTLCSKPYKARQVLAFFSSLFNPSTSAHSGLSFAHIYHSVHHCAHPTRPYLHSPLFTLNSTQKNKNIPK